MTVYVNALEISQKHKGIPYGGNGEMREDGDANYGFRYVKGDEVALAEIPELARDAALMSLASSINAAETGLFTVGSVSGAVADERGFRNSGYIEFSINSHAGIADARNYFAIFFHFDQFLHRSKFSARTMFNWQLQPATFVECDGATGFTCTVILNTGYSPSQEEADNEWSESLEALGYYLRSVPSERSDYLYPQQ